MPPLLTRLKSRAAAATVTVTALALLATTACVPALEPDPDAPGGGEGNGNASVLLGELTVADARPMKGYSRNRFSHWRSTGKNCDIRDTVLKRDGKNIELSGCNVVGGTWVSVYDSKTLSEPLQVDIDHMVPLANAWRSGADEWDDKERSDFANDLDRPQLFAVSASSNRSKGDQDPSQWKPANREYWCQYAGDWVAVKHHWKLSVTAAEKKALTEMLEDCTWTSAP